MKKLLLLLLILPSLAWSAEPIEVARMNPYILGGGVAASCNPATNEIGNRNTETTDYDITAGTAVVFMASSDCAGSLGDAYILARTNQASGAKVKVCIYNREDTTPGDADTLVSCSGTIDGGTAGQWSTAAFSSGTVTDSTNYYVLIVAASVGEGGSGFSTERGATAGRSIWYKTSTTWFTTAPADLGSSASLSGPISDYGDWSAYATIE